MIQNLRTTLALGAVTALVLAACGADDEATTASGQGGEGAIEVIASFYPLAEVAERVGGDRVAVTNLTPAGSEPHDLELDPGQVADLEDAGLVVVLGGGFQPAVEEVAARRAGPTLEVLRVLPISQEGAVEEDGHGDEEAHDHGDGEVAFDPHVWLDPALMLATLDEVTAALVELEPDAAGVFETNAEAFRAELDALDGDYEEALSDCDRSIIVVAHDAFGRLADRYDLTQEAIAGLSPEAEPDPARLAELTDLVEDEGITTVFTETLVSPRVAETLAREAGVQTAVLNPLEGLTDDQLGEGATYESVMRENLDALTAALGCG